MKAFAPREVWVVVDKDGELVPLHPSGTMAYHAEQFAKARADADHILGRTETVRRAMLVDADGWDRIVQALAAAFNAPGRPYDTCANGVVACAQCGHRKTTEHARGCLIGIVEKGLEAAERTQA